MATKSTNVYQRLQDARVKVINEAIKKSGKNINIGFLYLELEDIVPVAERIFGEVGLVLIPTIEGDEVFGRVVNVDNPSEEILFCIPYTPIAPIISNQGKQVTNPMQAFGASMTYMRRYLWQIVLDLAVPDEIEPKLKKEDTEAPAPKKSAPKKPATPEKREEVKKELTATDGAPDEMQVTALKKVLKKLAELDPDKEEYIQKIVVATEQFTKGTRKDYEALIAKANELVAQYEVKAK